MYGRILAQNSYSGDVKRFDRKKTNTRAEMRKKRRKSRERNMRIKVRNWLANGMETTQARRRWKGIWSREG
jgi:hypothetical protein